MKIEIENYKGQSISYNDDTDKFECEIELNNKVKETKRSSLKDVRNEIAQFLKANLEFKPFKFLKKSEYGSKSFETYNCSALRTDGKFVVSHEKSSNRKSYYDNREMKLAMNYDLNIIKELNEVDSEFETARLKREKSVSDLFDRLIPLDLSKYQTLENTNT